jgi:hypothetical protein
VPCSRCISNGNPEPDLWTSLEAWREKALWSAPRGPIGPAPFWVLLPALPGDGSICPGSPSRRMPFFARPETESEGTCGAGAEIPSRCGGGPERNGGSCCGFCSWSETDSWMGSGLDGIPPGRIAWWGGGLFGGVDCPLLYRPQSGRVALPPLFHVWGVGDRGVGVMPCDPALARGRDRNFVTS